ncbi:AraC family transcriptional regulator [Brachybacterium sp. YJGR34]|uniref:AraC family transcriptional regulator n=1 Tax=Brachybacterium sp. YJGR34 TaxID=2059911 RepID=UPI000E0ACC61|nr:AraC family transcriptional regulator [Brachybacterium sp. YJGR34]
MQDVAGELMARGRQVAVARVQGVDDNMARPHRHDYLEVYVLEDGRRDHFSGGRVHRIRAPEAITFPPADEHFSYSPPGIPFRRVVVYARPEAVLYPHALAAISGGARVFRPAEVGLATVRALVDQMLHTQEMLGERSQDELRLLLTQLLLVLLRQQEVDAATAARETRMARVVRHLHDHYTEHVELEELAEQFYVSRHHLSREFRRLTGTTVISYVNDLRVDQARRLLIESDLPIARIAEDVGFGTVTHFNRVFRDRTGTTPRRVRAERPVAGPR